MKDYKKRIYKKYLMTDLKIDIKIMKSKIKGMIDEESYVIK